MTEVKYYQTYNKYLISLFSSDLILMMDSSSQRFFRKIFSRYNTIPKSQFTSQTYSRGDLISFKNK